MTELYERSLTGRREALAKRRPFALIVQNFAKFFLLKIWRCDPQY